MTTIVTDDTLTESTIRDTLAATLLDLRVDPFLAGFAVASCLRYGREMAEKDADATAYQSPVRRAEVYLGYAAADIWDVLCANGFPEGEELEACEKDFQEQCKHLIRLCSTSRLVFDA